MDVNDLPELPDGSDSDISDEPYDSVPMPSPTFFDLLNHFEEVEEQYGVRSLATWQNGMERLRVSDNFSDAMKATLSLFHVLEDKVGVHAFDKPNELLLTGSRYGKPKISSVI